MEYTPQVVADLKSQVSVEGARRAQEVVSRYLPRTPLIRHPLLEEALGCEAYVKHENHLPTGSFKVRGGFNFVASLSQERRSRGLIAATRGNHGQSVAMAARAFGARSVILVPHGNNPEKNAAMKAYGAELIEHGKDFDEARLHAETLIERDGFTHVHAGNEPELIHGVATYSLEILEVLPDVEVVILPLGGGSGVCGAITVFKSLKPDVRIIGVQSELAPSIYNSWKAGERVTTETSDTFADGLATRVPFELTFEIIREGVDDIVLVSERELRCAIRLLLRTTHNLAEGAGAAPVAAALKMREQLAGRKVALILSGGNIDMKTLREVLSREEEDEG